MPRKGENIRKRKDGRWEGRLILTLETGEKKVHSVYGRSYTEVKKKMLIKKGELCTSISIEEKFKLAEITFGQAAEEFLSESYQTKKYSTYIKYGNIYRCYLQALGNLPIQKITNECIERELSSSCMMLSESVQKSIYSVLDHILSYAEIKYHFSKPIIKKNIVHVPKRTLEILNYSEQIALLNYLDDHMDRKHLGILISLTTGLRIGEVCALKWNDIDFKSKTLHINRTVFRIAVKDQETKTILMETEPKSLCSKREIPLPDMLEKLLLEYQGKGEYVLNNDRPMEPRTYEYLWKRCLKQIGISGKSFHSLRHTFATNCIGRGTDVKSLSEILGHSDVKITLNRYVHPAMDTKRAHINSVFSYLTDISQIKL